MLSFFRKNTLPNRIIAAAILVTTATTPVATMLRTTSVILGLTNLRAVYADAIQQGAQAGQQAAQEFSSQAAMPYLDGNELTVTQGVSNPITINRADLFPGSGTGDLNTYTSTYGSDSAIWNLGADAQTTLSTEQSMTGTAYRILQEQAAAPKPDMRNDPLWGLSDETLKNLDLLQNQFSDCTATTTYEESEQTVHLPDYQYCTRVNDQTGSCELNHNYSFHPILDITKGPLNRSSCGEGCLQVWIGQVGDNYWGGYCAIYETETWLQINNPEAIISATLDYATWDDYMLITLNDQPVYAGPYGGDRLEIVRTECDPDAMFCFGGPRVKYSATGIGSCELSTSWVRYPNVNVTSNFKNVAPGDVLKFKNRVEVAGGGEGYARITIRFDPAKVITEGQWYPDECRDKLQFATDGFCNVSYSCTRMPQNYGNGCITVSGTTVCDGTASAVFDVPTGFSGSPFCEKIDVNLDCNDFYVGDMSCWTDPQGVEHCPTNDGGNLQQCAALESSPNCAYMGRECVDGAQGDSGECYVWTEKFDCGYDTSFMALNALTSYDCNGPVSCFGADCINPAFESSTSYGKALAASQAAEFMAMDLNCTGTDGTQNVVCSVFDGEPMKCKIAVGGIVDCCEKPSGISLANYISLIMGVRKLDSMMTSPGLQNTALQGAWETLRTPIDSAWSAVKEPLTSAWDSLWGGTEASASETAKEGILGNFKQEVMNEVANWVGEAFGDAARDALFENVGGNYAFGGTVGTALVYIYYVYLIYMMVMLIIQLIWECEESEFELGAKRELKSCHYVGSYCSNDSVFGCIEKTESYCCFNSPLSRIIQEQVRPQLGMSWGTSGSPQCNGIPTDQLMNIDWAQVNLDEWLGILNITGNLPSTTNLNMDSLTGSGTLWGSSGSDHQNAADRAVQRIEGIDTTDVRQTARDEL